MPAAPSTMPKVKTANTPENRSRRALQGCLGTAIAQITKPLQADIRMAGRLGMRPRAAHILSVIAGLAGLAALVAQGQVPRANLRALPTREVALELNAAAGRHYRWDVSDDLLRWDPLVTWASSGTDAHIDSAAPYHASRFYVAQELSDAAPITGDHLVTADGDLVIHPVNHATLVLEWNATLIYIDPVGGATPFQGLPQADLILITHGHGDHFSSATIDAVRGANAAIVAPAAVYNGMSATHRTLTTVLTNGASASLKGIAIEAIPAYNLTASQHPNGVGNGYVLTIGERRIYIAGDTEDTPELRGLATIDVAFVPMNIPYTMSVAKAVSAVRQFRPKVVYPYHYRNQDGTFADLGNFKAQIGTDLGIEVRLRDWY